VVLGKDAKVWVVDFVIIIGVFGHGTVACHQASLVIHKYLDIKSTVLSECHSAVSHSFFSLCIFSRSDGDPIDDPLYEETLEELGVAPLYGTKRRFNGGGYARGNTS
jgi:hypothetical protein